MLAPSAFLLRFPQVTKNKRVNEWIPALILDVKRRELLRKIYRQAARQGIKDVALREGGRHSIVTISNLSIPIPRHKELGDLPAMQIMKQFQPVLGERWWHND